MHDSYPVQYERLCAGTFVHIQTQQSLSCLVCHLELGRKLVFCLSELVCCQWFYMRELNESSKPQTHGAKHKTPQNNHWKAKAVSSQQFPAFEATKLA